MSEDRLIREHEKAEQESWRGDEEERAANLFDLRRIIGALFALYGIVLVIVGIADSSAEVARAAGVRINLWAGIGMLALGIFFLAWGFLRPLGRQLREEERASEQAR